MKNLIFLIEIILSFCIPSAHANDSPSTNQNSVHQFFDITTNDFDMSQIHLQAIESKSPVKYFIKANNTVEDTVALMKKVIISDKHSNAVHYLIAETRKRYTGNNPITSLATTFQIIKENIDYKLDDHGKEQIKTTDRLFYDGKGDCDDFATLWCAYLQHIGINPVIKIVNYKSRDPWAHVYVIVRGNQKYLCLDSVLGEYGGKFGQEVAHVESRYFTV